MRIFVICLLVILLFTVTGCTTTQRGMTFGAILGAIGGGVAGYLYSEQTEEDAGQEEKTNTALSWSAIGAAGGALLGGIFGFLAEE